MYIAIQRQNDQTLYCHEASPKQCRNFPYVDHCPYLEREDLMAEIQPRVEKSLKNSWLKKQSPKNS